MILRMYKELEQTERLINEAQAYANRIVPEAKGEASKIREVLKLISKK